jgi:hypothetical protein
MIPSSEPRGFAFLSAFQPVKPITFKLESHYGLTRAYPVSQEAILLLRLTGTKTLIPSALGTIAALGFLCVDTEGNEITVSQLY